MDRQIIINKTASYVKKLLAGESTGHDWWHIKRVWNNAKHISRFENVDAFIVEMAAILHDIADWKFNNGDELIGAEKAKVWLEKMKVDKVTIDNICKIITTISFKGARVKSKVETLEGKVVQDADRLDAIGAIGIARTFAYGGHVSREIYNPNTKPHMHKTANQYRSQKSTTINHFYEKLLLIKDRLNTKTAKDMAENRHKFMEDFLRHFYKEWDGSL